MPVEVTSVGSGTHQRAMHPSRDSEVPVRPAAVEPYLERARVRIVSHRLQVAGVYTLPFHIGTLELPAYQRASP